MNYKVIVDGKEIEYGALVEKSRLRFQKKNGLEDLKKARKNLDWLIEEMEHEN